MQTLLDMPSPTNIRVSLLAFMILLKTTFKSYLHLVGKSEGTYGDLLVPFTLAKFSSDISEREHFPRIKPT